MSGDIIQKIFSMCALFAIQESYCTFALIAIQDPRNHRYLITDLETIRCGLLSWNFWDPLIYEEAENGDSDINPSLLSLFNAIFLSLLYYWLSSGLAKTSRAGTPKVEKLFCNINIY